MNSDFSLAVHGLVYLNHKGRVLSSEELAENICTNPVRVRRVMAKLKGKGLVETRQGNGGGYGASSDCGGISLAQVAQALDTNFVATNWRSGDLDCTCLVSSGMGEIMESILAELDQLCLERLETLTIGEIDGRIFGKQEGFHENI